jgi:hypothetical protein
MQVEAKKQRERVSLLQVFIKLMLTFRKVEPGDFHPIIN